MDRNQRPPYSGPIFPLGVMAKGSGKTLRGTIVGVRHGRSGETGVTRFITIKLTEFHADPGALLHADVELVVRPKP
jgi:hypothetical protein